MTKANIIPLATITGRCLRNSDGGGSTAEVSLGSNDLVIPSRSQSHAQLSPSVEVRLGRNASAGTLVAANRPELLKGRGTENGWCVGPGALVDIVGITVSIDRALLGGAGGGVVGAEVLDDVVLDEWVLGPAVDGQVAVSVWLIRSGVLDRATSLCQNSLYTIERLRLTEHFQGSIPFLQQGCRCFQTRSSRIYRQHRWCM